MIKANKLFFTVLVSAALAACGGGDSTPITTSIVSSNLPPVAVSANTAAAVLGDPFTFPGGVPNFGTTTPTTITFTSATATPAFSISANGSTATGITRIGSCTFVIDNSSFSVDSPLGVGKTVLVDPCSVTADTVGAKPGDPTLAEVKLVLGSLFSAGSKIKITVKEDGSVIIKEKTIGKVTISVVTGT